MSLETETSTKNDQNDTERDPLEFSNEIESMCFKCGKNGITRIYVMNDVHFKTTLVDSFECEHCGNKNNSLLNDREISEKGVRITLKVVDQKDLNRQVVKSNFTSINIPHLEFEIPAKSQKDQITTIEGIIDRSIEALKQDQPERREKFPEVASKIDEFLVNLHLLKIVDQPFEIIFSDISGICCVENPNTPREDPNCKIVRFKRTKEEDKELGILVADKDGVLKVPEEEKYTYEDLKGEALCFDVNCPKCHKPCKEQMSMINIPFFKDSIIMATVCEACGFRTNEVKSGTGIESFGIKIELKVSGKEDFTRSIITSETCSLKIPELDISFQTSTGRYTTVDGIIDTIRNDLGNMAFGYDTENPETNERMETLKKKLDEVLAGEREITLIFDDPAGNSCAEKRSDEGDSEKLKIEKYERSFEQNEDLGINDMKVENY